MHKGLHVLETGSHSSQVSHPIHLPENESHFSHIPLHFGTHLPLKQISHGSSQPIQILLAGSHFSQEPHTKSVHSPVSGSHV